MGIIPSIPNLIPQVFGSKSSKPDKFGVELSIERNGHMVPLESILGMGTAVHFVDQVKVNIKLGQILNIEITLNPPLDQAIKLLRSGSLGLGFTTKRPSTATTIDSGSDTAAPVGGTSVFVNKIAVKLHYAGLESPWFKGLLLQPDIDITADGIGITLKAIGMLFEASKTYPIKSWTGEEPTSDIIDDLIGDQVDIQYKPQAQALFDQPYGKPINSTKNNMELAKDLIQEKNSFMYQAGSKDKNTQTVVISTINEMRQKHKVKATFVAFRQIDPSNRQFPMIAFSAPIQNLLVPGGPWTGFKVASMDASTKTSATVNSPTETYSKERTGLANSPDGSMGGGISQGQNTGTGDAAGISRSNQGGKMMPTPMRGAKEHAVDLVKGFVHDATDSVFMYDVTGIGVMDLLPGQMVQVLVSDIRELSGMFDCLEVEHTMGSGGVETKMKLLRTGGLVTAASLGVEKIKGKVADTTSSFTKTSIKIPGG